MHVRRNMMGRRWPALLLCLAAGLAACGSSPTDPDSAVVLFDLEFPPDSSATPVPVAGIRIHVRDAASDAVLLTHDLQVEPEVRSRVVALEIKDNLHRAIVFELQLLAENGTALWVGRTAPMTLVEGDDPRPEVSFARAPPP